ncbi:hypothetical protein [uncultured Maricaulis sp.]|mgnify:FL=1|uniref:hypothetical protein n=1 Tax=uncultured Maricaulis sp. TaxID=174710 RepID=UPI0030DACD12
MQHVLIALSITLLVSGCAVIDMPAPNAGNPDWVEGRLQNAENGRSAPAVIPVTSLPAGEAAAMDEAARRLMAQKAEMEADANRLEADNQRGSATDFLADGQTRTQPPQQ